MLKILGAFTIFCCVSLFITHPLIFNIDRLATGYGDELVISWIQNWVIHSYITGNILNIFDANLYYPFSNSLAYSDTFFISSLFSLIPVLLIGEPIVAQNVTFILSLIFLGFSMYLLAYYVTKSFMVSLLSGLLILFSPAVLSHATHVQMLAIIGVPLAILFFLIFLDKKKTRYLLISLLFFVLQTYNSFLPGYFIVISFGVIIIVYWFLNKKKLLQLLQKKHLLALFTTILLLLPIAIPYYQVSKEFNYVRDIRDSIHFAMQPEDLLYPGQNTRVKSFLLEHIPTNKYSQNSEFKPGYLGVIFSVLVILSGIYIFQNRRKLNVTILSFIYISITGFILSLGPALHLNRHTVHDPFPIPLPYAVLYYLAPGFQGFRNSARWEMLFIIGIIIVIAFVLQRTLKNYSGKKKALIYSILIFGIIIEFNFPMQFISIPQKESFPKVYEWLKTTPQDATIIQLPIYNWGMGPRTQTELWREYYGTTHFRETVNGYTGFSPPPWQDIVNKLYKDVPSIDSIKLIKDLEIDYIVIDKKEYDILYEEKQNKYAGEGIVRELKKSNSLMFIEEFENHVVFKVK